VLLALLDLRGNQDQLAGQVSLATLVILAPEDLMGTLDSRDKVVTLAAWANQGLLGLLVPRGHREPTVRKVLSVQLDLRDRRGKLEIRALEVTQAKLVKQGLEVTLGHLVCKAHKDLVDLQVMSEFKANLETKVLKEILVLWDLLVLKVRLFSNNPDGHFRTVVLNLLRLKDHLQMLSLGHRPPLKIEMENFQNWSVWVLISLKYKELAFTRGPRCRWSRNTSGLQTTG